MTENARAEAERIVREFQRLSDVRPGESPQPFYQYGERLVAALAAAIELDDALGDFPKNMTEVWRIQADVCETVAALRARAGEGTG